MNDVTTTTFPLNNGVFIPRVGLGVFKAERGGEARESVAEALRCGYRHIDTAQIYGNEEDVGIAIRESGIPRDQVFVTTKLWNADQGYDAALRAFDGSMKRLGLEVLDLFLLHWPVPGLRLESWRALERLYQDHRVRAIGVSNFMTRHLDELLSRAQVTPACNQLEVTPFLQQREVRARCAKKGIVVEAYSPLTKGTRLDHPVIREVAERVGRSPAQVLLKWGLQEGLVILPKSTKAERIRENASLFDFELDSTSMSQFQDLEEGLVTGWDPRNVP